MRSSQTLLAENKERVQSKDTRKEDVSIWRTHGRRHLQGDQAPHFDGLSFDPLSVFQNGFAASAANTPGRQTSLRLLMWNAKKRTLDMSRRK
ncbi:hypothetical protein CEW89_15475 [Celeribacter ethanolicus]|uniref:Uncharacterized protein n=1 Tax=Celeribacter ethanolicus TaxID=1758178 RepID=A0A291GF85_9RHOB|nr:hypothetical protein CEW89_15475 [Celeribacter ethanolicus]